MEQIKKDLIIIGKWSSLYLQGNSDFLNENVKKSIDSYLNKNLKQGLFVTGQLGTGKSTLIGLIAIWKRLNLMQLIYYTTASTLFDLLIKSEDNNIRYKQFLCIDDLGRQYNTEYGVSKFNELIEYRYSNNLTTFLTSNLSVEDLKKTAGFERLSDILSDKKFIYEFNLLGNSKRQTTINNK